MKRYAVGSNLLLPKMKVTWLVIYIKLRCKRRIAFNIAFNFIANGKVII